MRHSLAPPLIRTLGGAKPPTGSNQTNMEAANLKSKVTSYFTGTTLSIDVCNAMTDIVTYALYEKVNTILTGKYIDYISTDSEELQKAIIEDAYAKIKEIACTLQK